MYEVIHYIQQKSNIFKFVKGSLLFVWIFPVENWSCIIVEFQKSQDFFWKGSNEGYKLQQVNNFLDFLEKKANSQFRKKGKKYISENRWEQRNERIRKEEEEAKRKEREKALLAERRRFTILSHY